MSGAGGNGGGRAGFLAEALTLLRMIRRSGGRRFAATIAAMLLGSLTEGVSLVMLVPLLHLLGNGGGMLSLPVPSGLRGLLGPSLGLGLATVLAGFVLLVAARGAAMRVRDILTSDMLLRFVNRLRIETFTAVAHARWEYLLGRRVSDLNHALTADIDRVQTAAMQLLLLLQSLVLMSAYLVASLLLSPLVTLVAGVVGLLALVLLAPLRRGAARFGETFTHNRQAQHGIVGEFLGGLRVARSLNAEDHYITRLANVLEETRANSLRFLRTYSAGTAIFQVVAAALAAGYIWLAVRVLAVPFANTLVLAVLFVRVVPPIFALQTNLQGILSNLHAFTTIRTVRDDCRDARERETGTASLPPPDAAATIALHDVSFRYPGGRAVLDGMCFSIAPNRITTLVGPSGSGKSTIADLLLRLLEPEGGTITVGDRPLAAIDRAAWRARIAYVQQETFLAHASLAANMRLARADATDAEIWQALADANADGFTRALPDGLETLVGDRGTRFSGGERQRLALARALLRRPHLLVLDEATSSLDWNSRRQVIETISRLRGRVTILAIDHGYGMAAIADDIVVLADGSVTASGPAAGLLRANPYLRAMREMEAADGDAAR